MRLEADIEPGRRARTATEWSAPDVALSTAAHELRNSLAPLTYSVAVLAARGEEADREAARKIAERELDCMRRVITDLEDLGRAPTLRLEPLVLQEQLEAALQSCAACRTERSPRIRCWFAAEPLRIRGDAQRLAQVFSNLLSNAVKFTGSTGTITVTARAAAGWAEVCFSDTGAGIEPDQLERVFELFRREQRVEQVATGLGIGLAVVRRLVEMHGGSVRAESAGAGQGTTVIVLLPLAQADAAPPAAAAAAG